MVSPSFLIVEGGGNRKSSKVDCRRGFRKFLENANVQRLPRIVAGGGRQQAFEKFKEAHSQGHPVILLVDREAPVAAAHRDNPWHHLKSRDRWKTPASAKAEQCHLMVQLLESWFLADPQKLADYFGQGTNLQKLLGVQDVEQVTKHDVYSRIHLATKATSKGSYDKGRDTCEILSRLDPQKVARSSRFAQRFLDAFK